MSAVSSRTYTRSQDIFIIPVKFIRQCNPIALQRFEMSHTIFSEEKVSIDLNFDVEGVRGIIRGDR